MYKGECEYYFWWFFAHVPSGIWYGFLMIFRHGKVCRFLWPMYKDKFEWDSWWYFAHVPFGIWYGFLVIFWPCIYNGNLKQVLVAFLCHSNGNLCQLVELLCAYSVPPPYLHSMSRPLLLPVFCHKITQKFGKKIGNFRSNICSGYLLRSKSSPPPFYRGYFHTVGEGGT